MSRLGIKIRCYVDCNCELIVIASLGCNQGMLDSAELRNVSSKPVLAGMSC